MYLTGQRKKCISFFLIGIMVFVTIAGAVLSAPVCVYALSLAGLRGTIASLIISLMLQAGVAPTNQTWIDTLNASYGVESSIGTIEDMITNGLLTESGGQLIDTGLSQAISSKPAYTDLGIDDIFTTLNTDIGVVAESGAVNLANQAINCGTLGTIGAFAGAVAIGVGVGVLANHIIEHFGNLIKYGAPLTYQEILSNIEYDGSFNYFYGKNGNTFYLITSNTDSENTIAVKYKQSGYIYPVVYTLNTGTIQYVDKTYNSNNQLISNYYNSTNVTNVPHQLSTFYFNERISDNYGQLFESRADALAYVNGVLSGDIEKPVPYSPDLIGQGGNQRFDPENNTYPNIGNIVPVNHDMNPVDMDDYQNYIDQANDNTQNGDVDQDQGTDFDDFVNPYFVDTTNQPIIPDNPDDIPTYPERPVVPEQPTIPDKTDPTNEDIQQSLEGATTIDLRSVFPFCIPWDIYSLVLIFDTGEDREAPHIIFTFPFNENWVVDVDLAEYNSVAAILRLLELIVFIVGLMVATRGLIGAKG